MRHLHFDFQVKKAKGNSIEIEGYANAAVIDRGKDFMTPEGWELENYVKNPVILFDHGKDPQFGSLPIGKALVVHPEEKGLYAKVQISSSKSEKISAVRDLVEEGILKTFSVGFDPKESQKSKDGNDVNLITKKELLEISIVPIPMNQDSTFSMIKRKNLSLKSDLAKKWMENFTHRVSLVKKGAWVASAVHQRLADLLETGEIRNREAALKFISDEADTTPAMIKDVLSGAVTPVDEKVLKAFENVLIIYLKMIKNLNDGDVALLERVMLREEQDNEGEKAMGTQKVKTKEQEEKKECNEEEKKNLDQKASAPLKIAAICFPKTDFTSIEAAKEAAAKHGYMADVFDETETEYIFYQGDKSDLTGASVLDLGNGVLAKLVPASMEEPKPEGEIEDQKSKDGKAEEGKDEFSKEEIDAAKTKYEQDSKATEEGKDGNPAAWVADESLWEKAKRASEAALGKVDFGFVTWWYLNNGGTKKSMPTTDEKPEEKNIKQMPDDNPYLQEARQTNSLLGTLITVMQDLSSKLNGIADLSLNKVEEQTEENFETESDDDITKSLDLLKGYKRDLEYKLKSLNV
jgi:HK97 family phage prohead protease